MTEDTSINGVVARNLAYWMREKQLTQQALAERAGVSQKTISNYLNPNQRISGSKGKEPSAKLTELSNIADALGIGVWQLLRAMTASERELYAAVDRYVGTVKADLAAARSGSAIVHAKPANDAGAVRIGDGNEQQNASEGVTSQRKLRYADPEVSAVPKRLAALRDAQKNIKGNVTAPHQRASRKKGEGRD